MFSFSCIIIVIGLVKIGESCDFDFHTDFPEHPPLIFDNVERSLVIPTTGSGDFKGVHLNVGDEVLIACAGDGNGFQNYGIQLPSITLTCEDNNVLSNGSHNFNFKELGCDHMTKSMVIPLGQFCANDQAELYQIGFNVTIDSQIFHWYPTITSCFDPVQSRTYYSHHSISGLGLSAYFSGNDVDVDFDEGNKELLYPDFSPQTVYKQKSVNATLDQILGPNASQHITNNTFIINRGHLAPNGDFFYDLTRYSTYYYINVAPQWSTTNQGAWNNLEQYVRNVAKTMKTDFEIYTGTHEKLTFLDDSQQQTEIYLYLGPNGVEKLAIPRFYWKIVHHTDPISNQQKGMAFVSYNNDTSHPSTFTWPCTDICESTNWDFNNPSSTDRVICCDAEELMKAIPEIPEINVSDGILEGLGFIEFESPEDHPELLYNTDEIEHDKILRYFAAAKAAAGA